MSDTPETDTYWQNDEYEALRDDHKISRWSDFARKLERERDEAREKAERYRLEANAMMMQRDEARRELSLKQQTLTIAEIYGRDGVK